MMRIFGASVGMTRDGDHSLLDGGGCLLEGGAIRVAIAEERITRQKYASGFVHSLRYCLDAAALSVDDIDLFVFSNCCDRPLDMEFLGEVLLREAVSLPMSRVKICPSHHLSHACSAFFVSPFDEAIVMVADGEGNVLDHQFDEQDHWGNSNERISYYLARSNTLTLIERDAAGIGDLGLGCGYDYVSSWIGFPFYKEAGKTMALAAGGTPGAFGDAHIFTYENNKIKCLLEPIHSKKSLAVRRLIKRHTGQDIGVCKTVSPPGQCQKDMARLVQDDLERVLIAKVNHLVERTGVRKLCIAGGVGLNCVANSALLSKSSIEDIFIQPAACDSGQCLGNALYGHHILLDQQQRQPMIDAYHGKTYANEEIEKVVAGCKEQVSRLKEDMYIRTAEMIAKGAIVGWFQGGSEFGPRALGNRSILADPRSPTIKDKLNKYVKFREPFRPFAPSILLEKVDEFFEGNIESPFMLLAVPVRPEKRDIIPAVVHIDGSARLQTVDHKTNPGFRCLLEAFEELTSIPILLNTSFNVDGEPIVESPEDAMRCFTDTAIDVLAIGDFFIVKKNFADQYGFSK